MVTSYLAPLVACPALPVRAANESSRLRIEADSLSRGIPLRDERRRAMLVGSELPASALSVPLGAVLIFANR